MYAHKTRAVLSAIFTTAASLSLIAIGSPANAGGAMETVSREVFYHDLDLSKPQGVTQLNQRIKSAANRICRVGDSRDLKARQIAINCRKDALAKAGADIQVAIAEKARESQLASLETTKAIGISK